MFPILKVFKQFLVFSTLYFVVLQVVALDFWPTEREWVGWGDMCQTRYTVSGAGQNSAFTIRVPSSKVVYWENKVGHETWSSLHHYCAGLIFDSVRNDPARAVREYTYSYQRVPKTSPFSPQIGSKIAFANYKANNKQQAVLYAQLVIRTNPNDSAGYVIKGMIERKEGQIEQAIKTLENGFRNTQGTSAELNYHLGIAYFNSGDFNQARKYANSAYNLGYPLPWLRDQLKIKGHWN
jgi:tetratricopeptide (TPR) repeat protein